MTANLDDDSAIEKTVKDASKAFTPPEGLKERMRAALLAGVPDADIAKTTRGSAWLWQGVAAAAAACVVAGWCIWLTSRGASVAPKVNAIVPRPVISPSQPDGLAPRDISASFLTYHRVLNESPQVLNSLLEQEAKSSVCPMRSLTDMDASRFLQTLDPVKENGHESRNMGSRAYDGNA
jgi:hypothetical protein